ncbi:hypothetical protein [Enteractinococcus coprophilus]|uniref:Uncharacterized protein n=1 Tax=Enteractinococcus coprophilus TaxID=1027633 RepID=A0A543AIN6_9MICC|nr:hypothetical protein [Enteractinococcus coprophilus]TQL72435.1 hypothetical protein FB556_1085 [Enteractinococcus coprophilus]
MKYFASARFLLIFISLSIALQLLAWSLLGASSLIGFSFVLIIATMGVLNLWLAVRIARANRFLQSNFEKAMHRNDALTSQISARLTELSSLIDLNTESIREFYQNTNAQPPHPREQRALDEIHEVNQKVDALQQAIAEQQQLLQLKH